MANPKYPKVTRKDVLEVYPQFRHRLSFRPGFAVRRMTAWKRAFPEIFLIGVQKCGTTSLQKYLLEHPSVVPPYRKEMKYFDLFCFKPLAWYVAHFPLMSSVSDGRITLDATPDYIFYPGIADQIKKSVPDARFIVSLRDPVDRAFSQYLYSRRRGYEDLPFMEALDKEDARLAREKEQLLARGRGVAWRYRENSYKRRGLYAEQLSYWFDVFSAKQFVVIDADKLKNQRQAAYDEILAFFDLPPHRLDDEQEYNKAPETEREMGAAEENRLREFYREPNQQLFELLGREFDWK
jgi:hypothetical protein